MANYKFILNLVYFLKKKWKFETGMPIFSSACLINDSDLVTFGCHDGFLYCLEQSSGELKWKFHCNSQIYSNPTLFKSHVCCINSDGIILILSIDGNLVLKQGIIQNCFSSPIIYKNKIFVGSRDNFVSSFEIKLTNNHWTKN